MPNIDELSIEISSKADSAVRGVEALAGSLEKLKRATSGGLGLSSVGKGLESINRAVSQMGNITNKLSGLSRAVKELSNLGNVKISASIGNQITRIGTALSGLNIGDGATKIQELVAALKPLETLGKSSLGATVNALNKLPEALRKLDTRQLYTQIQSLTRIMQPLATEMQKIASGFSAFPSRIQRLISDNERLTNSNNKTGKSYVNLWAGMRMAYNTIRTGARLIGSAITKMNDYIENVNLFNASMGEYAKEAEAYAEKVGEVMGIDPGEWMRNQGMFMTLATGFGVVSDRAYIMSKNLTQLGYDISSFFNIPYEDAMAKLQSGIAGELEPLRRIGYDLSQARLQQEAYTLGIDKKLAKMTQAEKAELRYYTIMKQVTTAQGDMSRTLSAPANQLRILSAQFTQAARAIGSIFIPMLNAVLPYAIAVAKVIRIIAATIASLFGFEMPSVDYSDIGVSLGDAADGADNLGDGLGNAAEKAKELQKYTMGFDELNVIDPSTGANNSNNSSGDTTGIGSGFDFELPEYDFIGDAVDGKIAEIMEKFEPALNFIKTHMDDILDVVLSIGAGILAWKLVEMGQGFYNAVKDMIKNGGFDKVKLGITLMVTGFTLEFLGAYDLGKEGITGENIIKTTIGAALGIAGSLLTFGTGPLGWTIGIGATLAVLIAGFTMGVHDKLKEEDLANRFGDYVLSDSEIASWVSTLTNTEIAVKIKLFVSEQATLESAKMDVESAIQTLNSYNFKIQCGIDISESEYQSAVDKFVESAETYIQQKTVVSSLAIDIMFEGDTSERLSEFTSTFYGSSQAKLSTLGSDLKKVISEGFVDGEWIPDKMAEALELQKEIQGVLDYIATVDFEAKITALKLDASNTDISPDSFTKLLEQANATISEQMKNLEGVRLEALKIAKMEFDQNILNGMSQAAATDIYDKTVAEAEKKFQDGKVELAFGTFDFGMDVLMEKYRDEIDKTIPILQQSTEELFTQGFTASLPEDTYKDIDTLVYNLHDAISLGFDNADISGVARENIEELLKELAPTTEDLEKAAEGYIKLGKSVPENISQGLRDQKTLAAMTGDVKAINYLVGDTLSKDQSFLDMLATCENAGKDIDDSVAAGLMNNLTIVEDASNGTITFMNDTIGKKVVEVTPELVQNLEDLGFNISAGLKKGVSDNVKEKDYKSIWQRIGDWFKNLFGIHSPSTVFAEYGKNITDGLFKGISDSFSGGKQIIENWAKAIKDWFTGSGANDIFNTFKSYATKIIGFFKSGIDESSTSLQTPMTSLSSKLMSWFSSGESGENAFDKFKTYAKNAIDGFKNGIEGNYTLTEWGMTNWAGWIAAWFDGDNFDKKFNNYGKNSVFGFRDAVEGNYTLTEWGMTNWIGWIVAWFGGDNLDKTFNNYGKNSVFGFRDAVQNNYTLTKWGMTNWASWIGSWFNLGDNNESLKDRFYKFAGWAIDGFKNGINALYTNSKAAILTWGSGVIKWFKDKIQFGSPSKLFYQFGEWTIEGFNNAVYDLGKSTKGIVENWADSFTDISPQLAVSVDTSQLAKYNTSDFTKSFSASVATKQSIRYVENGEHFSTSIANGVASANSESNALLREQNLLLREMLEKESGVYLDGKKITKSVEKHKREMGRTIVRGGAY